MDDDRELRSTAKVIGMEDHWEKFIAIERAKNAAYVREIRNFFDRGTDDLRLQTLAIYIDSLEPRKRQVFADEWNSLQVDRHITEPSLDPAEDADGGGGAPEPRESA